MTASHQLLKRPQDALAVWVEDLREDSFLACVRETKIFDGLHKKIKVVSRLHLKLYLKRKLVFKKNLYPVKEIKDNTAT